MRVEDCAADVEDVADCGEAVRRALLKRTMVSIATTREPATTPAAVQPRDVSASLASAMSGSLHRGQRVRSLLTFAPHAAQTTATANYLTSRHDRMRTPA